MICIGGALDVEGGGKLRGEKVLDPGGPAARLAMGRRTILVKIIRWLTWTLLGIIIRRRILLLLLLSRIVPRSHDFLPPLSTRLFLLMSGLNQKILTKRHGMIGGKLKTRKSCCHTTQFIHIHF